MADAEAKPKSGKGKLIIIAVAAIVLLAGGGAGAWWFLMRPKPAPTPAQLAAQREKNVHFITLEPFLTNVVSQDGNTHYLQVKIDLKTSDMKADDAVKNLTPEIRNTVLRILASQHAEQVTNIGSRDLIRDQILVAINRVLGGDGASAPAPAPAPVVTPVQAAEPAPAAAASGASAPHVSASAPMVDPKVLAAAAAAAKESAARGPIEGVYFTGFVVQ